MKLTKCKLGQLIELCDEKNIDEAYSVEYVKGISTQKYFIETKANMDGVSLKSYKIVRPGCFAYVPDTSRRGDKISLAYNDTNDVILVSSISNVFMVKSPKLIPNYLFMFFNRPEFDRYARYNSFGSAREPFNWEDMCDIDIELPDVKIQEKYVKIYLSMIKNRNVCEKSLEDLRITYEGYIEKIRNNTKPQSIINYLTERKQTNKDARIIFMKGVGMNGFIAPNQKRSKESLKKCNIFYKGDFIYAPSSIKNGVIVYNDLYEEAICTEEYIVFSINNEKELNPYYLLMWMKRKQLGRYIDFASCDSVRNRFYFDDLSIIEIPIPNIKIQEDIANVYRCYLNQIETTKRIDELIKDICPILIKGALEEANEEE